MATSNTSRVALVTGASRGIGRAIAEDLGLTLGFTVAVNYLNSKAQADEVVAKLQAAGGRAAAFQADVASKAGAEQLVRDTVARFGRLDVLVHNASVIRFGTFSSMTEADYDALAAVQKGTFFLLAESSRHLQPDGRVVYISSGATHAVLPAHAVYSALKAAGDTYARHLAVELAPKRITVNTVSPGFTDTDMLPAGIRERAVADTPLRRLGTPTDLSNVVSFLVSEKGGWITGQNVYSNGGLLQLQ